MRVLLCSVAFLLTFLWSCEEHVLTPPQRPEVLVVRLSTKDNRTLFAHRHNYELRYQIPPEGMSMEEWNRQSQWQVPFEVWVCNRFDEAVEGTLWIELVVHLEPADGSGAWHKTLAFADTVMPRYLTLAPGDSIRIETYQPLLWQQDDDSGRCVHLTERYLHYVVNSRLGWKWVQPDVRVQWVYCDTVAIVPTDTVVAFDLPLRVKAQAELRLFKEHWPLKSNEFLFDISYFFPVAMKRKLECSEHIGP
ncbi:MAG: hypothetical protein QHJ34_12210 [bacterium]|nr:hypothetical protein [candidate division KSB1 bacterium]MDH7560974.1 hypothetical protein [bacterium]